MNGIWDRLSLSRTTTGTPPAWWTSGPTPLAFHHAFPRSYAGLSRAGEAAGRSPCPCVPQVDADVMVWLRFPHDPLWGRLHIRPHSDAARHTSPAPSSAFRLLSRVGEGDLSAHGCGLTGRSEERRV